MYQQLSSSVSKINFPPGIIKVDLLIYLFNLFNGATSVAFGAGPVRDGGSLGCDLDQFSVSVIQRTSWLMPVINTVMSASLFIVVVY